MSKAPIVLFTYKRLDTLKQTIAALQENYLAKESDLIIFSDAAKHFADKEVVDRIRDYLKEVTGFQSVKVYAATSNKGLAKSIIEGVSSVINEYGKAIVLEDDLKTTPNFLNFMNASLENYKNDYGVFSVSGYSFNLDEKVDAPEEIYLLNRGWSWGWATWEDRWNSVDWAVSDYDRFLKNKVARKEFSRGGSDLVSMLKRQMNGTLDSWAIRWFYHQFKVNGLTVYSNYSKVYNNGFDEDATHTTGSVQRYLPKLDQVYATDFNFPKNVEINAFYQKQFQRKMSISSRIVSKIRTICKTLFKYTK